MLVQQLKERVVKGSIYCVCKYQYKNSLFQPSENFHFDIFFSVPNHGGPYETL